MRLVDALSDEKSHDADDILDALLEWTDTQEISLYEAQEEAFFEICDGKHVILNTPTGSGKSLVAVAAHFYAYAKGMRSYYTSPIKALVNEKFFALCETFRSEEHTSELQSRGHLVCRLLLEKKKFTSSLI